MEALSDGHAPVLVWGGGSGGIAAALQAARAGADTVLLTPGPWLGGMVSAAGVCAPDGNELTPWQTGMWGALLRALALEEPTGLDHNWVSCFAYRPASAERILRRWLAAEPRLRWWPGCRLLEVERSGPRIRAVRVQAPAPSGTPGPTVRLSVGVVIDGSDRGDLFPLAAVPFRFGWEPQEQWQEPSAPAAADLAADPFFQRQPLQSPTWVAMARLAVSDPVASSLPPAAPAAEGPPATALPPPFEGACDRFGLERTLHYGRLPGGAVMLNWPVHGNDWHGGLERAFAATTVADFPATSCEADLAAAMREHSLAFARALGQASGGALRIEGLFPTATAARAGALEGPEPLALMPYWREGRRLRARDLVLEQHLLPQGPGATIAPLPLRDGRYQGIAVGNYANDHHYPGPDWPLAPKSCRWGGRWSGTPFAIPYGALVSEAVENLLAADKCLGVSHMANGATRLQPLVLNIGQAAGQAAALALAAGLTPAELPVDQLQRALIADPMAPASPLPLWDLPWHHPHRAQRQRQALADPSLLGPDGCLTGPADPTVLAPWEAPPEPGEALWEGNLQSDGDGGYGLETAGGVWPLITLEPGLHRWLLAQERSRAVRLIGCANPWGPWLRVSRLAERP
jgi:hypothetical protein